MLGGAGILALSRYGAAVLGFASTVIIVRELSEAGFGQFSLIMSVLAIVGMVSDMRLSRAVLASVLEAGDEAETTVGSYIGLRIVIGAVSLVVFMAVMIVGGYPQEVLVGAALVGASLIIASAVAAIEILCDARLWIRTTARGRVLGFVAQVVMVGALAVSGAGSVDTFLLSTVANFTVVLVSHLLSLRGVARLRPRFVGPEWWAWLREAAPLSVGSALDTIYFRVDMVMLSIMGTFAATGHYAVGYKFSDVIGGAIPIAVLTPALTMMVRSWPGAISTFHRTFRHALILLTVAGVGIGVGFAFVSESVITTAYGARYATAATAATWLVIGQVLHFYTALCFTTLMAVKRNVLYPVAALAGVALNIGLNLLMIPRYSYTGSSVATVITEVVVLAIMGVGVIRIPGVLPFPWRPLGKIALAGGSTAALMALTLPVLPWPVSVLAGAASFFVVLHLMQVDGPGGLRVLLDRDLVVATPSELATAGPMGLD